MLIKFVLLIASSSNFGLGFFVFLKNPQKKLNKYFAIFALWMGLWVLTNFLLQYFVDIRLARFSYAVSLFLPAFAFLWSYFFLNDKLSKNFKLSILTLLVLDILFFYLTLNGNLVVDRMVGVANYVTGSLFWLFSSFLLFQFIGYVVYLIYLYINSSAYKKNQIRLVIFGFFILIFISSVVSIILPLFGLSQYNVLDSVSSLPYVALSTYSILAHHLFDIRVIIKRAVIYSTLLAFVLITYSFVVFIFTQIFNTGAGTSAFAVQNFFPNIIAAIFIAFGFNPLQRWLSRATDRWLFKGEYIPEQVLAELSDKMRNVTDLDEALNSMMQIITKALRVKKAATFVIQKIENNLEVKRLKAVGYTSMQFLKLEPDDYLIKYFSEKKDKKIRVILVEDLKRQVETQFRQKISLYQEPTALEKMIKKLEEFKTALVIPLYIARQESVPSAPGTPTKYQEVEQLIGIFTLGEKLSGDIFASRDIQLLEITASQTASAIEKTRFFEEDILKTEFVSIASHELLTPTAAMTGYLSMILDEGIGKVDQKSREYLSKVYNSAKRLTELVKELLDVSRIERGKIQINATRQELLPAIEQVIDELQIKAKEKRMEIMLKVRESEFKKDTMVWADEAKLIQVLINLIGNAIKYSLAGTVTIEVKKDAEFAVVSITDTGIGIPKQDLSHLFEKFFRAKNSDKTGASGTGLGLYITKSIIELMAGRIWADSVEGKGSTFYFTLPLAK